MKQSHRINRKRSNYSRKIKLIWGRTKYFNRIQIEKFSFN